MQKNWHISRRTFLRGAGVSIALPLLDAMEPAKALAAEAAKAAPTGAVSAAASAVRPPVRMAAIFFPNGVYEKNWVPEQEGRDYKLPFSLEPLDKLKSDCLVLSNLDKKFSHDGDGHYAKTANFLTGLQVHKTVGKEISAGGISLDQLAAQKIGHLTPLPSMELGIDPVISGIDSNVGYTRLYGSHISWRNATTPTAKEINPRLAYQRLFSAQAAGGAADLRRKQDDQSLLDMAMEDAKGLRKKLGRDDQFKLDEYLDSIRAVEKRIEFFAKPDPRTWKTSTTPGAVPLPALPAAEAPGNHLEHVRLMLDLMILAFQTDSTRISTFMFANCVSGRNFTGLIEGVKGAHHEFSHHENKAEKYEPYSKINRWHVEQFAYMIGKMKAIKEGQGTLLDNSMIVFGSSMSDGNRHDPNNLPILVGGKGGGTIDSGRHLKSAKNTPLCNLYLSLLERMGAKADRFGDSTGAMKLV
jgi:hypothetical protein